MTALVHGSAAVWIPHSGDLVTATSPDQFRSEYGSWPTAGSPWDVLTFTGGPAGSASASLSTRRC